MKIAVKLWVGILILIILSPLGLLLPGYFNSKEAWGEWGVDTLKDLVGYIPQGLSKFSGIWKAPLLDYQIPAWEEKGLSHLSLAYIMSAAAGVLITVALILFIARILTKKGD